jgi:hypothetical protein
MFPVLVGAIVLIVASGVAAGRTGRGSDGTPARRVADARVADGDLSPARRAQLLTVLDERLPAGGARRVLWLPAAAVVTLIVVLAAVAGVGVNDAGWAGNGTVMAGHMGGNGTGTTTATSAASRSPWAVSNTNETGNVSAVARSIRQMPSFCPK